MTLRLAILMLPVAEIAVLIMVGGAIGVLATLLLLALAFLGGLGLVRNRGLGVVHRVRAAMERGEAPVAEVFDTACVIVAGLLLMIPGFITDALALPLLLPGVRRWVRRTLGGRIVTVQGAAQWTDQRTARPARGDVIEGEWHEVREETPPLEPPRR